MESDARIPSRPIIWGPAAGGRDAGACDWKRDGEDGISSSAHILFDCDDFDRRYHRIRSPRTYGGPSHHRGAGDEESYVGSVHHHYPNHSSVKAIHPNSQIFRPCYPAYGESVACGSRWVSARKNFRPPEREEWRGEALVESPSALGGSLPLSASESRTTPSCSWGDAQHARPNQNRCCANCSSNIVREQCVSIRRSEMDSSRVERDDRFQRFGRGDPLGADVGEYRRGGGFLRPESSVDGWQRMEFFSPDGSSGLQKKHPLLRQSQDRFQHGCCAYQHGELNSNDCLAFRSECYSSGARVEGRREASEGPTGAARRHPPRPHSPVLACRPTHPSTFGPSRDSGRETIPRVEVSAERRGEESLGRATPEEEEGARLPLLQEQLRVLLWALLGSERLQTAAACEGQARGETTPACWSRTPVEDLLGTVLGACDCLQCRPKRCFRDLACSLLNKCPPLSDKLAGGGPGALGRVVASVYHSDLMPSIRRHEADLPDAVRRSMTRVARLEWALNRTPPLARPPPTTSEPPPPAPCMEARADRTIDAIILSIQEKLKGLAALKDLETRGKYDEQQFFNPGIRSKLKEDVNKQRFVGCSTKRPHDWLHPHHQFLMDGLANDLQTNQGSSGDGIHCADKRGDQSLKQEESAAKNGNHEMPMKTDVPIMRRKRGRPPKIDGQKSIISSPRKKRILLWKFLITLLDGVEAKDHYLNMSTTNQNHSDDIPCTLNSYMSNLVEQCKEYESSCIGRNENGTTRSFKSSKEVCRCEYHSEKSSPMVVAETNPCSGGTQPLHTSACLQWICREDGLFRILDTADLAKRWGLQHKNPKMTYEKMSRAMRTYYQRKVLVPVPRSYNLPKKLVYKFNPAILKKIPSPLSKQKD